jgi:hypothetical protein
MDYETGKFTKDEVLEVRKIQRTLLKRIKVVQGLEVRVISFGASDEWALGSTYGLACEIWHGIHDKGKVEEK